MGSLDNKVVIMAGAGGIGDGCARRYAAEGAAVVIGDLNADHAIALASQLNAEGYRATGTALDGGEEDSIKAMVDLAVSTYGRLDGLHCNYGDFSDGMKPVGIELDLADWDRMMHVNARGFLICTRYAVPEMVKAGGGSILYTSSIFSLTGNPIRAGYAMSKAALHALSRSVAVRHGPDGIRSNVIAPGWISHPKLEEKLPPAARQSAIDRAAIKRRVGMPDDIAAMGALLLSDEAGYITGQLFAVDGGITMRP